MKRGEYKSLCRRIKAKFGRPLNLLYIDACELADLVLWGTLTEDALFLNLQAQSSIESGEGNQQ